MLIVLSLLTALSSASTASTVTFTVDVHQASFLPGQPVTVTILDSEQLRRAAENEDCMTSIDRRGNMEHFCLDGNPPLEIKAETFTISYEDLGKPVVISSATVSPGEAYRLGISGSASDNCNSAGGSHEGTATTEVKIQPSIWMTEMACLDRRDARRWR